MRGFFICGFTFVVCAVLIFGREGRSASAQGGCRLFTETGQQVCGIFLEYWNRNGGLAQQGFPLTAPMSEVSDTDGKVYTVQYFERAVFEHHPEYGGSENEVLLSLLGNSFYRARYSAGAKNQQPNTEPGSVFFRETGKRLGGRFLAYWQGNGGLRQQGYPISNEFTEKSDLNGKEYRVQYFERAVFEYHPENAPPYDVLLTQLGSYRHLAKYGWRDGDRAWRVLRSRAAELPILSRGEACKPSTGRVIAPHLAQGFGSGPVYPILGVQGAAKWSLEGAVKEGDWFLLKTLWVAPPGFQGPVLIRGGRLDATGEMRFGPGPNPQLSLELSTPVSEPPGKTGESWREWPQYTRIKTAGCYAYRIDGIMFSEVVVIEVGN